MPIEFYDVKLRKKVAVDDSKIRKVTFDTKSGLRYGLKGKTEDGRKLTTFVSKANWDSYTFPEGDFED